MCQPPSRVRWDSTVGPRIPGVAPRFGHLLEPGDGIPQGQTVHYKTTQRSGD